MTAIAAFIALSSTPLLAQTTDGTADQAAPVVVAPPPPAAAPAAPTVSAPAPTEIAPAPAPAMKTVGTPVVHEADAASTPSQPAAAPTRAAPVKRVSPPSSARASAPVATGAPVPAKVTTAQVEATPAPAPVAKTVPAAPQPATDTPPAAPAATATQTTQSVTTNDETLPIAGGIGLAVIALGGAAYAFSRRRRDDDELVLERTPVETVAVPEAAPVAAAPVMAAPVTRAMPKTLPNGFDISRFGRHTQAAYLGRTPDNPSYSLKRRLKRASFFDQREREAAAAGRPIEQAPVAAPAAQAARTKQDDGQITIRMAPQRQRGGLGYLFQR